MDIKSIFIRWEKLRLLYNLLLTGVFCYVVASAYLFPSAGWERPEVPLIAVMVEAVLLALAANLLYFAGPLLDSYLSWLGLRFRYQTHGIFLAGVIFSIGIEVGVLASLLSPF